MGFSIDVDVGCSGRPVRVGAKARLFLGVVGGIRWCNLFKSYEYNRTIILPKIGEEPDVFAKTSRVSN